MDLLGSAAQARAKNLNDLNGQIRLTAQELKEVSELDDRQVAVCQRSGIGSVRAAVNKCDFPEGVTLAHDTEHDLATIRRGYADLHCTRENSHQSSAGLAPSKDDSPSRQAPPLCIKGKMFDCRLGKPPEQPVPT